jgi:zinc ribbon protein/Sel1 repeat-containing protein
VRRTYCGHENPDDYLFCGVCGSPLAEVSPHPTSGPKSSVENPTSAVVQLIRQQESSPLDPLEPPAAANQERVSTAAPETHHSSHSAMPPEPFSRHEQPSSVAPHSLLGLDDPPTTSEIEYLLEEVPSYGPLRTLLVVAAVIAVAVVGGWQVQQRGGTPWVMAQLRGLGSPKATSPAQASAESASPAQSTVANNESNLNSAQKATSEPPSQSPTANQENSGPEKQASAEASAATSASNTASPHQPQGDKSEASKDAVALNPDRNSNHGEVPPSALSSGAEQAVKRQAIGDPESATSKRLAAVERASKITEPVSSDKDDETAQLAEKYLYGNGVPQDCNRAVGLLQPAADSSNPKAQTLLGAMYATGHCVPRDLPSSYHWFALALRQQPKNIWLEKNLESVWNQMNSSEKQLAMRMTNSPRR